MNYELQWICTSILIGHWNYWYLALIYRPYLGRIGFKPSFDQFQWNFVLKTRSPLSIDYVWETMGMICKVWLFGYFKREISEAATQVHYTSLAKTWQTVIQWYYHIRYRLTILVNFYLEIVAHNFWPIHYLLQTVL